ncbi:MAG: hypothetical protein GXP25_20015 [Planctomycetes bacterium]|nr:hypothetical protein [Planctomycetota bacterium]
MAESVKDQRNRVISFVWVVLFVGAGAFFSVLLTEAIKERQREDGKSRRLENTLSAVRSRVESLKLERDAIQSDPICVEGAARLHLNYSKPGEISYQRENVKLERAHKGEKPDDHSPLAALIEAKLDQWQVPITVLAVIVIALVIVRGFTPKEEASTAGEGSDGS